MNSHRHNVKPMPVLPVSQQPLVYAQLSSNAYHPGQNGDLPKGFTVFMECPEEFCWWGYFGKGYFKVDEETQSIIFIFSHRGTDNTFGSVEDIELWLDQIIPAQYRDGALPFMQWAIQQFNQYAAKNYRGYEIKYEVTGQSLGAALAQNTLIDSVNGVLPEMNGVLFENPGLPNSAQQKPRPDAVKALLAQKTVLINTRPDAINTLYPTDSRYQFHLQINNAEYPRIAGLPLPLCPNGLYYIYPYSFKVTHPIAKTVDYLKKHDASSLAPMIEWPYGFENGFDAYTNYESNRAYWDGYIHQLWQYNGLESIILQILFDQDFKNFSELFKYTFLNHAGIASVEIKPDKSDEVVWEKLTAEHKAKFNHDLAQFKVWMAKFYQQLSVVEQPLLTSMQASVTEAIVQLLKDSRDRGIAFSAIQKRYQALCYVKENISFMRSMNHMQDEQTVLKSIFAAVKKYFDLSPHQIFATVPEALTGIDLRDLNIYHQVVQPMPVVEPIVEQSQEQPEVIEPMPQQPHAHDAWSQYPWVPEHMPQQPQVHVQTQEQTQVLAPMPQQTQEQPQEQPQVFVSLSQQTQEQPQVQAHIPQQTQVRVQSQVQTHVAEPRPQQPHVKHEMTDAHVSALLRFLENCTKNLPNDSEKRKQLFKIATEVTRQRMQLDLIKEKISEVKKIVSTHRNTKGILGFFNKYRQTTSLDKFNEIFDEKLNVRKTKNTSLIHHRYM